MTANSADIPGSQESGGTCASLEKKFDPLLQKMLVGVRRHRETALLAGFNGQGIVTAALLSTQFPANSLSLLRNKDFLNTVFNKVVIRMIRDQPLQPHTETCSPHGPPDILDVASDGEHYDPTVLQWLSAWLEKFCMTIDSFHPQAIGIVILRAEGCDERRTARRLGLTHRLVNRIVHDICQSCDAGKERVRATIDCQGI